MINGNPDYFPPTFREATPEEKFKIGLMQHKVPKEKAERIVNGWENIIKGINKIEFPYGDDKEYQQKVDNERSPIEFTHPDVI